jgi:hypothetical protein
MSGDAIGGIQDGEKAASAKVDKADAKVQEVQDDVDKGMGQAKGIMEKVGLSSTYEDTQKVVKEVNDKVNKSRSIVKNAQKTANQAMEDLTFAKNLLSDIKSDITEAVSDICAEVAAIGDGNIPAMIDCAKKIAELVSKGIAKYGKAYKDVLDKKDAYAKSVKETEAAFQNF